MFYNLKKNIKKGFTLLELLVVIGLITILATIAISSYTTAQKKARDAQKQSDLKAIQSALEQYYAICGYKYPTPVTDGANKKFTQIICTSPSIAIMPTTPVDPFTTPYFCSGCSPSNYTLCTTLEINNQQFCVQQQQ